MLAFRQHISLALPLSPCAWPRKSVNFCCRPVKLTAQRRPYNADGADIKKRQDAASTLWPRAARWLVEAASCRFMTRQDASSALRRAGSMRLPAKQDLRRPSTLRYPAQPGPGLTTENCDASTALRPVGGAGVSGAGPGRLVPSISLGYTPVGAVSVVALKLKGPADEAGAGGHQEGLSER